MFIRRTKTRTLENGSNYFSYRLVGSYRSAGRVRQHTLLNLGSGFSPPRESWPEICQRVEQLLAGQQEMLPCDTAIEEQAESIAQQLLHRYSPDELLNLQRGSASKEDHPPVPSPAMQGVDLNSVEVRDPRSVGGEGLALSAIEAVGLPTLLEQLDFNRNQLHAAIGNIVGRMVQPGSELSTHEWLQSRSALGELLSFEYEKMGLSALYRASDLLWSHREEIENHLYQRHMEQFDLQEQITLYDLTNTFFEGSGRYNAHAAYGHSKERRNDCLLVTLALVLDGSGFSRRSRIFAGNVSEPSTLQQMIEQMRSPLDPNPLSDPSAPEEPTQPLDLRPPPTIVMDAGIASEENIRWLTESGYRYIVVSRKRHMEFNEAASVIVKQRENDSVRAMRVERDGEVELYCHSQSREYKEQAMQDQVTARFEVELDHLAEGLSMPRRIKSPKAVRERIGRLRERYSRASRYYEITTETDQEGKRVTALHYRRIQPKDEDPNHHPGVYCLRSNQMEWDEQQLWSTYTLLTDLEAVFRSLKSELGMRPVFHQKTDRVEGHIFITLLAYNLIHQLRLKLKEQGIDDSWSTLRATMETQMRVTVTMRGEEGRQIHIRQSTRPNALQKRILGALHLPAKPGEEERTIVTV
jgi:transposase